MAASISRFRLPSSHLCVLLSKGTAAKLPACARLSTTVHVHSSVAKEKRGKAVSKAMLLYLSRTKKHDEMMKQELDEYDIGRRHLANIMGKDPDDFTQEDIDDALEYLLPSGLFDKRARPMMKHPSEIFATRKEAEFNEMGRPLHYLFYTTLPNYYGIMHRAGKALTHLNKPHVQATECPPMEGLTSTEWIPHLELKKRTIEDIDEQHYNQFVTLMESLASHPKAGLFSEFLLSLRQLRQLAGSELATPQVQEDIDGRKYSVAEARRKRANAEVKLHWDGTGKLSINGKTILYFDLVQERSQVMFPLQFTECMEKVDVEATVEGGGPTGQAGAIRLAISKALTSFVDENTKERMRIAGLLTFDPRNHERKKPGQHGARKKKTWKKR